MATAPPLSAETYAPLPRAESESQLRINGLVRDIREDAEDILRTISGVVEKGALDDPQTRVREVFAIFGEAIPIFAADSREIDQRLGAVRELFDRDASVYDAYGDGVSRIENAWQHATLLWSTYKDAGASPDADALLRVLGRMRDPLHAVIFESAFLTIPPRVNLHLRGLRIGQTLDFHATFVDELPDRDDRVTVLRFLAGHPAAIEGIIDVDRGLIYRASPRAGRRRLTFAILGGLIVFGALAVYVISNLGEWLHIADWPLSSGRATDLVVTYALVLAGAAIHIVIDALKQQRANAGQGFSALEEWALWIHIKETSIIASIVTLWVGFIGMVVTLPRADWLTAVAVGYSIDSVADLYLQRFATAIETSTATATAGLR